MRLLQVGVRHPTFGGDCDVTRCLDEVFELMVVAALLWKGIIPFSVSAHCLSGKLAEMSSGKVLRTRAQKSRMM